MFFLITVKNLYVCASGSVHVYVYMYTHACMCAMHIYVCESFYLTLNLHPCMHLYVYGCGYAISHM